MAIEIKQTETFRSWESKLKDKRVRTLIATRVMRMAEGLAGDIAPVGGGISEPESTMVPDIVCMSSNVATRW
jgi:putative addiction module killer protein